MEECFFLFFKPIKTQLNKDVGEIVKLYLMKE